MNTSKGKTTNHKSKVFLIIMTISVLVAIFLIIPKKYSSHTEIISSPKKAGIQTTFPSYITDEYGWCVGIVVSEYKEFNSLNYGFKTEGTKCKGLGIKSNGMAAI